MNPSRPRTLVFVAGTATEVGKTWWTAALARELRAAGRAVAARKPVQSGNPGDATDAELLAAATGEDADVVCPPARTLLLAWAPPMAARELGLPPFSTADLAGGIRWPASVDVGLVEGVGGPRSPISDDGDNVDLAHLLAPDLVVLVADAGLGTVNAVRLSMTALADFPVVVALNRYDLGEERDPLHARNLEHLTTVDGFDVVTSPRALADRVRLPPGAPR
jgi:dethiobiotin synthetase